MCRVDHCVSFLSFSSFFWHYIDSFEIRLLITQLVSSNLLILLHCHLWHLSAISNSKNQNIIISIYIYFDLPKIMAIMSNILCSISGTFGYTKSKRYEFESHSGDVYSIQCYVMKFVSDLRQVSGLLWALWFPPPIKLTTTI